MSCSRFIEHEDEDESDTLVIIVNGDGTVNVDRQTLERVIKNQCRAAVSVIKLEESNEPDSQTENLNTDRNERLSDGKDSFCHKVNLVVEGYYPPPPLNPNAKSMSSDSVVSSTVGSEFLDLLAEGLEIPESQSNVQTSIEGCIGDSLVDAFSEMAPEQLKQVETALHSEKAKQILGDGVSSVLDTLKIDDADDWIHLDHCYTASYCGNKKSKAVEHGHSKDSNEVKTKHVKESSIVEPDIISGIEEIYETLSDITSCNFQTDSESISKKTSVVDSNVVCPNKVAPGLNKSDVDTFVHNIKEKRSPIHIISKVKKKGILKSDVTESFPERIVKDDEVDGVKVFKPMKSDRRLTKHISSKDNPSSKTHLVQTRLNFAPRKDDASSSANESSPPKSVSKNGTAKKDSIRKPVTPEIFGPALFSTPDIIRKIGSDDTSKESYNVSSIDTADLEKRMSAIENGEFLENITLPSVEPRTEKVEEKMHIQDDNRLLNELENSADELTQAEEIVIGLSKSVSDLDSPRRKSTESIMSDTSDKNDVEYEDDPNKLWCICNKPHNNRFMICCDACDNWFHGYCVGITKAMGEKMEQNGTEWLCPSCKKEKTASERESKQKLSTRSIANRSSTKRRSSHTVGDSSNSNVSFSSTQVETLPTPQNTTERSSTNQTASAAASRRKSSSLPLKFSSSAHLCIVCKENEAMPEGLYCSNACIVRYVAASVENMNSGLAEPLPEDQKIIVVDKKNEQLITGMRGPSISELRSWLADHPSFEIVKPSAFPIRPGREKITPKVDTTDTTKTPVATKTKDTSITAASKLKPSQTVKLKSNESGDSSQTSIKHFFGEKSQIKKFVDAAGHVIIKEGNVLKTSESKKDVQMKTKEKDKQRPIKLIPAQPILKPVEEAKPNIVATSKSTTVSKPTTSTPISKKPTSQTSPVIEKPEKAAVKRKAEPPKKEKPPVKKQSELKRQDSKKADEEFPPPELPAASAESDRVKIRKSIRVALNELFISRIKDVKDINVCEEELTLIATQVEEELFNLFNDTNTRYKSKYRSLRFNIKDQKNTLFRRIAERSLRPYDLVRLTPEELASTELAQWREREAKHEIDMIKKTELENLSQTKVLVLKTHKGELEIEPAALPMAPDTVVPDLHPDELPVEADKSKKSITAQLSNKLKIDTKDKDSSKDTIRRDREKDRHKKHDHKDKHKSTSKHHRRSSERERHRSRSRKRSKSKESKNVEKKDHRSKTSTDKKHESRNVFDKDRQRSRNERRSRSRSRRKNRSPEKKEESVPEVMEGLKNESPSDGCFEFKEKLIVINKEDEKIAAEILSSYNTVDVDLSDMEPTSTVTIRTPPYAASPELPSFVWKGTLIMPDVVKLHARLREVSGKCEGLDEDLPSTIDCVGRINPSTVWEYISKTKKNGSREILVLRFEPVDDEQHANYFTLYSYLNRKDRMAVVGSTSPSIKDFYVIPLAGHSPVPQVLLPLDGPGFEDSRSHMLLGVIVRSRRHDHQFPSLLPSSHTSAKKEREPYIPPSVSLTNENQLATQNDTFTPPHSPTSVFVRTSPPTAVSVNDDDDEPYSPEDDEPYSPGALDEEHENESSRDLQREMEALNRQIEEQKEQIKSISSSLPQEESTEFYSPTEQFGGEPETSNVQLPGDLQQLLNSLNRRSNEPISSSLPLQVDPIIDAYKQHEDSSDDEEEREEANANVEAVPPHFSPPSIFKEEEKRDDEEAENERREYVPESAVQEIPTPIEKVEPFDDSRQSRDPRRKFVPPAITPPAAEPFRMLTASQPPPPGMEDEFPLSGSSTGGTPTKTDVGVMMVSTTVSDPAYVTAVPSAPYVYGASAPITAYPPPNMIPAVPPMYLAASTVFSQPTTLPFAHIPSQQIYMPPTSVLPTDPSMIPLPIEPNEVKGSLKRKSQDEDKEKDKDRDRRSNIKTRKSYRDSKSPPSRDGSAYDSHYRNYRRDDDNHSRYGHGRHERNYRNRSGYWKSGSDYSSSSRRKYSDRDRRSSSRERSSSKHSGRWDSSSKHVKDEWDDEIQKFESQKRDKSDRKSESSRRS